MATRRGEIPSPFTSELIFEFTAAHLYEWDEPKRSDRQPAGSIVSDLALDPLLRGHAPEDWLDTQAIGRVENRLRHHGMPPRTVDEMAERLRLLGDMTGNEIFGPMASFLAELEADGRALSISLAATQGAGPLDPGRGARSSTAWPSRVARTKTWEGEAPSEPRIARRLARGSPSR